MIKFTHVRSGLVFKNIVYSGIIKVLSILISILSVPLTLNYLNQDVYGIWLTIFSIMNWLMYFDGGLGSGLKNKITESKAHNEIKKIKTFVSTSYFILTITVFILIILFSIINNFLDWNLILNVNILKYNFNNFIFYIFIILCFQFLFRLIESILIADQRSSEADFINFISSIISISFFYFFKNNFNDKLLFTGITFCLTPVLVNFIYSIILFKFRYKDYSPSVKYIEIGHYKELMKLGSKFFIIQICNLITIGTINLLISNSVNPSMFVVYNLTYKYFGFTLMGFTVITNSIFTSFNDAYNNADFFWIKKSVQQIQYVSYFIIFIILLLVIFSKTILNIWVGNTIYISSSTILLMALYYIIIIIVTVYSTFISGIGKIKIAYYFSILNTILFLPVTYFSGKYFGLNGILVSQIILNSPGLFWLPKQYNLIINKNAKGIWNA